MLTIIGKAMERGQDFRTESARRDVQRQIDAAEVHAQAITISSKIKRGIWHDGRLDCVAGNGVMSELGFGDEPMTENDALFAGDFDAGAQSEWGNKHGQYTSIRDSSSRNIVNSLPVVIIKNFASRNASSREELLVALANWAAELAKNKVSSFNWELRPLIHTISDCARICCQR